MLAVTITATINYVRRHSSTPFYNMVDQEIPILLFYTPWLPYQQINIISLLQFIPGRIAFDYRRKE